MPHTVPFANGYAVPFMGSDKSVARRTQRYLYENESTRPIQIETYVMIESFLYLFVGFFMVAIIAVLAKFDFGRSLLLKVAIFV